MRYISMEYVEGSDLRQLARELGGFLPANEAFEAAIQSADGLQAIHDVGIIHRDLKASNIMRDPRGLVRLMDFGIAKIEGADRSGSGLTSAGQIMGTPEYISPEQCLGDKIDHRSDIYALGIVIYETFTGQVPFRGDTPVATLFKHIQDPVPFEGPVAGRIPLPAVPVLRKALAKNRADRHASAAEMAEDLRRSYAQALAGASDDSRPTAGMSAIAHPPMLTPETAERRLSTRLEIFVTFQMRRVGSGGTVLGEELTVAENISRGGARVMTTMASLAPGDVVELEERGGKFRTRAEVRGSYVGPGGTRRLNLRFLDSAAPDYLVRIDDDSTPGGSTPAPRERRR
jgi:hypothetical protein